MNKATLYGILSVATGLFWGFVVLRSFPPLSPWAWLAIPAAMLAAACVFIGLCAVASGAREDES